MGAKTHRLSSSSSSTSISRYCTLALGLVAIIGIAFLSSGHDSAKKLRSQISAAVVTRSDLDDIGQQILDLQADVTALKRYMENTPSTSAGSLQSTQKVPTSTTGSNDVSQMQATIDRLVTLTQVLGPVHPSPEARPPVEVNRAKDVKSIYDGANKDPSHIGGSTVNDTMGQSPALWTYLTKSAPTVRSVIDVGCGRGISTKWFLDHGADVLCVEGGSEAISRSWLPSTRSFSMTTRLVRGIQKRHSI